MNRTRIFILALGLPLVAIVAFTVGMLMSHNQTQRADISTLGPEESANQPNVKRLTAENLQEREKAAKAISKQQESLIHDLVKIAAEPDGAELSYYDWHNSKHLAMLLLGDLRAPEAVQILLEGLEYKNPVVPGASYMDLGGRCPAAEALSKIGMPAIGPTIDKLGSYDTECLGRELCCWVIKEVLGARLGRLRLEIAIEEARDETVRNNLGATLPYFKTDQEKAAEERAEREKAGQ